MMQRRGFNARWLWFCVSLGLGSILRCGTAGTIQEGHDGTGSGGDQYIARLVNGMFTLVSTKGEVEGYDLRPGFFFLTSQFSTDGTVVAGYAGGTFTVLNDALAGLWTRRTLVKGVTDVAVSPGGIRVAYLDRATAGSQARTLGFVSETENTTSLTTLTLTSEERGASISWDSTGKRIVFEDDGNITILDIEGRGRAQIGRGCAPSWSPDGSTIAYRDRDGSVVMYDVVDATSSFRVNLTPSTCAALHWSPDSRMIFTRESAGQASDDCYDDDGFVAYQMENLVRLGAYSPCGLRDNTYGWLRNVARWRTAAATRMLRPR